MCTKHVSDFIHGTDRAGCMYSNAFLPTKWRYDGRRSTKACFKIRVQNFLSKCLKQSDIILKSFKTNCIRRAQSRLSGTNEQKFWIKLFVVLKLFVYIENIEINKLFKNIAHKSLASSRTVVVHRLTHFGFHQLLSMFPFENKIA